MTPANAARYRDFVTAHFDRVDEDVFGDFERECGDMCNWMPRVAADMVLFTDESGFNLQCTRRSTGRAPRGKRLFVTGADDRGPNHSLVIIVSATGGVVAKQWHRSGPKRGEGFTRERFVAFLETEFAMAVRRHRATLLPRARRAEPLYLVMDNASIHKGPAVTAALAALNVEPVFLPPYSPELNPCELVFSMVKGKLATGNEIARVARAPQLAEGAVTQVRAGSLLQRQRQQRLQQRGQRAERRPARSGPGGARKADQAVRSAWLRSRVLDRLADVQPSNVTAFYRKCAWGNVVEDAH